MLGRREAFSIQDRVLVREEEKKVIKKNDDDGFVVFLLLFFDSSNSTIYIYINRYIERLIDSHIRKVKRDRNKKRKRNYVYTIIIANGGKLQTIDGWHHRLFRINPFRYSDCFWINW